MDRRELYQNFLSEFPFDELAHLPIDRYTNLNRHDSFCYWLESKSEDIGSIWGSTSYKFGIYQYQNKPSENSKFLSDGTYAWLKKLGNSHSEAYSKVIEDVVRIAQAASQGKFDEIDTDDYAISPIVRWKIAFLYSNERLIPIYKKEMLVALAAHYGMVEPEKASQAELNAFLIEKKGDKDIFEFYDELLKVYKIITPSKDGSDSDIATEEQELMERLISKLRTLKPFNGYVEQYKWDILDKTDGKDNLGIVRSLFNTNLVDSIGYNNLFKNLSKQKPQELSECLDALFDENVALDKRVKDFKTGVRKLYSGDMKRLADDERTAASLLTCKYPDKYTFYQNTVYKIICDYFGYETQPTGKGYGHFMEIINHFAAAYGEQVQELFAEQVAKYNHKPLNLAIQTLFWCMKEDMKQNNNLPESAINNPFVSDCIKLLKTKYNIVLQGAPGTGKTYIAKQVAASIVSDGTKAWKDLDDTQHEQVGFVQFHPSFDYTDFVEGLRPDKDGSFSRQDGIFKEFCKKALKNLEDSQKTLTQISSERRFEDLYQQFISDIEDKPIEEIQLRTGGKMKIIRITENNNLKLGTIGTSDELYTVSLNRLRKLAEVYPDKTSLESIKNISKEIRAAINGCHASAYYATLHFIYDNYKTTEVEVTTPVEKKAFVFIIDEINRGELSKIFGELFYSIEPDYRGVEGRVKTQYINMVEDDDEFKDGFYIPENVYVIGTMNDVDRGVEAMDFAIRRRFAWKEVTAEESARNMGITGDALAKMNAVNELIRKNLGQAYCIGGAYFRKLDADKFEELWANHLCGIITEYFRGEPEADARVTEIKAAYDAAKEEKPDSESVPSEPEAPVSETTDTESAE